MTLTGMRLADIRKVMTLTGMGNVVYLLLGIGKPGKSRDLEKCHFLIRVLVDLVRLLVKIGGGCFPGIGKSGTMTLPTRPCPSVLSFMSWPSVFQDVVP